MTKRERGRRGKRVAECFHLVGNLAQLPLLGSTEPGVFHRHSLCLPAECCARVYDALSLCVCVCVCVIQQSLIGRSDIVPPPLHPTVSSFTIWCASVGWESPNALARLHHHRCPLKQCICTSSMPAENHLLIFDTYTFLCAPIKYLLPVSAPGISSLSMPVTIDQGRVSQKHSCAVKFMRSGQHGALQKTLKRLTCIHLKIVLTSFIIYSCLCQSIYDILWRDLFCPQRPMQWKLMWSNLFWLSLYGWKKQFFKIFCENQF